MTAALRYLSPSKNELLFVPLGGAGEIGMNMSLYGTAGSWLMIDCGVTFADGRVPGVDLIVPDPRFILERRERLVAIVITHAHEDHIGAVPYLWRLLRRPVYATPFACALLGRKLAEVGLAAEVPVHEINAGERIKLGPFTIDWIHAAHSIPEGSVLAIRTAAGTVVHATDWRLDPAPLVGPQTDETALERLGAERPLAAIVDSTNVFVPGESGSEAELRTSLIDIVGRCRNRVAIACFASNVARLETIASVAAETGREMSLVGRSMWNVFECARETGYLRDLPRMLTDEEASYLPREKVLLAVTGSQGEERSALSRIVDGTHPEIELEAGDTVIFSSRVIPGNERAIGRVQNGLARTGIEVITDADEFVHVSGHPARGELARLYGLIKPQLAIPIHGETRHLVEHARFARECHVPLSLVAENGAVVRLAPGAPETIDRVPTGRLAVDGARLLPIDGTVITTRRRVAMAGAAVATVVFDGKGRLVAEPKLTAPGLLDGEADRATHETCLEAITDAVESLNREDRRDDASVIEAVRNAVRRTLKKDIGRRPVTEVHVIRL